MRRAPLRQLCIAARVAAAIPLLCAGLARAAEPDATAARTEARAHFARGQERLDAHDPAAALDEFRAAYRTLPNAAVLLSIADCQLALHDHQGAAVTLEQYLKDAPDAADHADVEARLDALRHANAVVAITSTPPGASIWVDGLDSGKVSPTELEVAPGDHLVELRRDGLTVSTTHLHVSFAERRALALSLAAPERAPGATEPPPGRTRAMAQTDRERERRLGWPFWTAAGVGGAGVLAGTVFGSIALQKQGEFDRGPSARVADAGERAATTADVAFAVATVAGVTALVLYLSADPDEEPPPGVAARHRAPRSPAAWEF